jgi:tmRNA-binding protein
MAGTKGKKRPKVRCSPAIAPRRTNSTSRPVRAGIVLTDRGEVDPRGRERQDGYAKVTNGEVFLHNAHISPTSREPQNVDLPRTRKLLLNRARSDWETAARTASI